MISLLLIDEINAIDLCEINALNIVKLFVAN